MSAIQDLADLAQRFEADRRHLRSVAFQLLGSVADADDAVQSARLKASRTDFGTVENLAGWFTRPQADPNELDRLAEMASAPADEDTLLADSVSRALLVVLDRLSPAQRVAFMLHDVFAMPFETIAGLLERSPAAAKKLASRAHERLLLAASRGGDIATLLNLLAPDVVRRVDRALVPDDVPTELRGARQVAQETRRFARRARAGSVLLIDGVPGIVVAPFGRAQALLQIGVGDDNRIHIIDITAAADRLSRAVLALPSWPSQECHRPIGYQGHQRQPAGGPARGRDREHHA